jgi:hypothetical protein
MPRALAEHCLNDVVCFGEKTQKSQTVAQKIKVQSVFLGLWLLIVNQTLLSSSVIQQNIRE